MTIDAETGEINEWMYQEGEKIDFARGSRLKKKQPQRLKQVSMSLNYKHPLQKNKSVN